MFRSKSGLNADTSSPTEESYAATPNSLEQTTRPILRKDKPQVLLQLVDAAGRQPPVEIRQPNWLALAPPQPPPQQEIDLMQEAPPQLPQPPQQEIELIQAPLAPPPPVNFQLQEEEEEMAEALIPVFTGLDVNASDWITEFDAYAAYKNLNDATKIALFKLRMGGTAKAWVNSLAEAEKDTLPHLNASFRTRWFPKQFERHTKMVRSLFTIRQEQNKSVDTFISRITQKAQMCGEMADQVIVDAAASGLLQGIQSYVIENRPLDRPLNIQDILTHGRIAEITRNPVSKTESILEKQIMQMSLDIAQMSSKLSKLSTASVSRERSQSPARRQDHDYKIGPSNNERTQSPHRHVTFASNHQRSQSPARYDGGNQTNEPMRQWKPQDSRNVKTGGGQQTQYAPSQNTQFQSQQPRPLFDQQQWQGRPQPQQQSWKPQTYSPSEQAPQQDQQRWQNHRQYQPNQQQWQGTRRCFSCNELGHGYRQCKNPQVNQQRY